MTSLFELFDDPTAAPRLDETWKRDWPTTIDPFPIKSAGVPRFIGDYETNGTMWHRGHRPVGCSITIPLGEGRVKSQYLAWGHREGNNISEEAAKRYFHDEVRDVRWDNQHTKFEVHMHNAWTGEDLDDKNVTIGDVSYNAALIDDHRRVFNLDALVQTFCPDQIGKLKVVHGIELDKSRMADYHAGVVGPYACQDGELVERVRAAQWPIMDAEDLHRVRQIEEDVTFATVEMERNGVVIDQELLDRWLAETEREIGRCYKEIHRLTGVKLEPNRNATWEQLFSRLNIPVVEYVDEDGKRASFTDEILEATYEENPHEALYLGIRMRKIAALRSKAFVKFKKGLSHDGVLRYALHQVRGDENGTVSGRYSSTDFIKGVEGASIQTWPAVGKQIEKYGKVGDRALLNDWYVRQLVKAADGKRVLASDAAQIEYRIFADYARDPAVMKAYADDPWMSFHKHTWKLFKALKENLAYKPMKNLNFAKIYGAGLAKICLMMGFITKMQWLELQKRYARSDGPPRIPRDHPWLAQGLEVENIYREVLPQGARLIKKAQELAKERGYVCTISGRRMRFPLQKKADGSTFRLRPHKGLNGVIQGGAADVNKVKLTELRRARKELDGFTLRATIHDEILGDTPNEEVTRKVDAILNAQSFPQLKIPILWDTDVGDHWAACSDDWERRAA